MVLTPGYTCPLPRFKIEHVTLCIFEVLRTKSKKNLVEILHLLTHHLLLPAASIKGNPRQHMPNPNPQSKEHGQTEPQEEKQTLAQPTQHLG
jgi:hypothetical protein